jgi:hypothetical protein
MRISLVIAWLFVGLAGAIFHFGPGKERAKLDRLDQFIREAENAVKAEQWSRAMEQYDLALAEMPSDRKRVTQQIILEKAKAQMLAKQLPEARQSLEQLLADVSEDEKCPRQFVIEVESALANSQYYMTWLMRLEGLPKEEWLPEIESARQHFTHAAQWAESVGDEPLTQRSYEDLEAAVRLARMDLQELQGLPLPSQ